MGRYNIPVVTPPVDADFYERHTVYRAKLDKMSKNSLMRQPIEGNTELLFIAPPKFPENKTRTNVVPLPDSHKKRYRNRYKKTV